MADKANGYEARAANFIASRTPSIGPAIVREWARALPPGASILDIGCGHGIPISQALIRDGFNVSGIDASETMITKFRENCHNATAECSAVEQSTFFDQTFDGVVAWGLLFLLPPATQKIVIGKVALTLKPQGRFLFTSPREEASWIDALTGLESTSLGYEVYRQELDKHGLMLLGDAKDEGDNFYYFAMKP